MEKPAVHVVSALGYNYVYIVDSPDAVLVIDPGEAGPVLSELDHLGKKPTHIMITHYDYDHIGGLDSIVSKFDPIVIGPEPAPIHLDHSCRDGEDGEVGGMKFRVINTEGHASPHVCFYEAKQGWLFAGDCMFGSGCGRVRNNAYRTMFESLQKLAALPEDTQVFFGHEYTLSNLAFAASVEPGNARINAYQREVAEGLKHGRPSSPSTLAGEKQTNPFLRVDSREIRASLGMPDQEDSEVFTALRKAKNVFKG